MCLINFFAKVRFELGCDKFERKREETEHRDSGLEGQRNDDIADVLRMDGKESPPPNEQRNGVRGPEEQKG